MTMDERKFQGFLYLICGAIWVANGLIELSRKEYTIRLEEPEDKTDEQNKTK